MDKSALQAELDQLLSEEEASVRRREATRFDELAAPLANSLVLFGAGKPGPENARGLAQSGHRAAGIF